MKYKTRTKIRGKLLIVGVFFCLIIWYYMLALLPIIKTYCTAKINALTEQALNLAVSNVINTSVDYNNLMTINYSQTGEVSHIMANQYMINTITREVVKNAHEQMKNIDDDYMHIPLGTLTGIALLLGRGPNIRLNATPVAIIGSSFDSNFISVGINNTLHQIYLNVTARVEMTLPLKKQIIKVNQQVLLCESVIVGKVPNVYLNSGLSDKVLNLVPN